MSEKSLYSKYRPTNLDEVIGQDEVVKELKEQIEAKNFIKYYLFAGPRGCGKTTISRILANEIFINTYEDKESGGNYTDNLLVINIDASVSDEINIDELRKRIDERDRKIIIIIDEANAISKYLEKNLFYLGDDIDRKIVFIFNCIDCSKVSTEIKEKCRMFELNKIGIVAMVNRLKRIADKENINIDENELYKFATNADGNMRDVLSRLGLFNAFDIV